MSLALYRSPLDILNGRTKDLDTTQYAYKLQQGNQYGIDVIFADEPKIDESRMAMWVPVADGNRRDGVGDLLEVGGIDVSRHKLNPIFLFDHAKTCVLPIGLFEDRETKEYTFEIDTISKTAGGWGFFYQGKGLGGVSGEDEYDHAKFCNQLFHMASQRVIRGASIGYSVTAARELPPDYERGIPKGLHLQNTLMLEGSLVVLPANADTVNKMLCDGVCCGEKLSPMLVKSLAPYKQPKKAQLGYEDRKDVVPVPHNEEITGTDIPPSRWKPGAGAVKNTGTFHPEQDTYQSLETADSPMKKDMGSGRFEVVNRNTSAGPQAVVFRTDDIHAAHNFALQNTGMTSGYGFDIIDSQSPTKWTKIGGWKHLIELRSKYKALSSISETSGGAIVPPPQVGNPEFVGGRNWVVEESQESNHKKLSSLREKYRTTKGLRRRLKRSSTGSSVMYVHEKDLQAIQSICESRGMEFMHLGAGKIKLTGDDGWIDDVAKKFGRPMKIFGGKKSMPVSTKSLEMEPNSNPEQLITQIEDAWSKGSRSELRNLSVRLAQTTSPLNLEEKSKDKLRKLLLDREFFRCVGHILTGLTKSTETWHQKRLRLDKLNTK